MAATAFEVLLAQAKAALVDADVVPAGHVHRGRVDDLAAEDAPAIVIRRSVTSPDDGSLISGQFVHRMEFSVECVVTGDDWETDADALHQQAHLALVADGQLLAADIELSSTDPSARAGDITVGAITATYAVTVQPDIDLT